MTDEKLKTKLMDAFQELPEDNDRNKIHALYIQTKGLLAIAEAKKDYPTATNMKKLPKPPKDMSLDDKIARVQLELFHERVEWYKRWFGSEESK